MARKGPIPDLDMISISFAVQRSVFTKVNGILIDHYLFGNVGSYVIRERTFIFWFGKRVQPMFKTSSIIEE